MQVRAAIFDMDGLLVDTEPLWRRVETRVFAELGVHLTDALCESTKGLRIEEVVAHWHSVCPWQSPSVPAVVERIVDEMLERIRTEATPKPGVRHAIDLARAIPMRLALASSSHTRLIRAVLERLELVDAFEVVCSGEHEPHGKPHPGIFLTAASRLGVEARACVVFEDSIAGVIAGKAARMRVVAIPESPSPAFAVADVVRASLLEVRAGDLTGDPDAPGAV
ncbi:MAG: hexitol phosphatase HxpB [Polyangiales bacterium]|nr:hexitol phosphatase HxpB [Myxococcales bacterium]